MLSGQFAQVRPMLGDASENLLVFTAFRRAHRRKSSTNPLERLNGGVRRRADVARHLPQERLYPPPATAVVAETHDEWTVAESALPIQGVADQAPRELRRRKSLDQLSVSSRFQSADETVLFPINARSHAALTKRANARRRRAPDNQRRTAR